MCSDVRERRQSHPSKTCKEIYHDAVMSRQSAHAQTTRKSIEIDAYDFNTVESALLLGSW